MKKPKVRELKEALVSLFSPAYTTPFPVQPHEPFPKFRGKPVVDDNNCVGCETCANVCPPAAITTHDDREKGIRVIRRDYGKCIFCGQCEEHCITGKGVQLSDKIFDIAGFDRDNFIEFQTKELLICQNCGAVITTKEHMQFLHRKLGPKAFSSLLNLKVRNDTLSTAADPALEVPVSGELQRKDMFNILCPNCLRSVLIKYV
jgi:hydrogenase-4 component H